MEFKKYQELQIKNYLKTQSFLLIANGLNQKSINWVEIEQKLENLKLKYLKIYNKITKKIIYHSIYNKFIKVINGPIFFFKPNKISIKQTLHKKIITQKTFKKLLFSLLTLKLNKKFYSFGQLKKLKTLKYKKNIILLYQFLLTNLKKILQTHLH